jgi:hypothetical protein
MCFQSSGYNPRDPPARARAAREQVIRPLSRTERSSDLANAQSFAA